jgi:hypothetical protein
MADAAPSLAATLKPLAQGGEGRVTLQDIIDRVEHSGGLAPVLFVLTLPVLLPLPPGASMVLAAPLLLVAPQLIIGRQELWLPQRLARQSVRRDKLGKLFGRILPWLEKLEAVVRPRLTFLTGRAGAALAGVVSTAMAVVLVLPLPFANLFPALTVLILSLGLARRDGLMILAGFAMMSVAVTGVVWGLHGARIGLHHLMAKL